MNKQTRNEGWADDITTRNKRHYYKDGQSLCGKEKEKPYFRYFDKESKGSVYAKDCAICIKKLNKLNEK